MSVDSQDLTVELVLELAELFAQNGDGGGKHDGRT